jgi:Flp pilus assembly protein TadD
MNLKRGYKGGGRAFRIMTASRRSAIAPARLLTLAVIATAFLGSGCASFSPFGAQQQTNDPAAGYAAIMRAAEAIQQSGDLATAAMLYQRAHHLNPQMAPPLIALGEMAASAGSPGRAATAFREALSRAPDDINARRLYGNALLAVDAAAQAAEQFRHVLRVEPEDTRAMNALGVALDLQGEHEEAQRTYRKALEREPNHLPLRNNLALSIALTGDVAKAAAILEELGAGTESASGPANALHHQQVRENLVMVLALDPQAQGDGTARRSLAATQATSPALATFWHELEHEQGKAATPRRGSPEPAVTAGAAALLHATASGLDPAAGPEHPAAGLTAAAFPRFQAHFGAHFGASDLPAWSWIEETIRSIAGSQAPRWFAAGDSLPPPAQ